MPIDVMDRWQSNNPNGKYQGYTQNFDMGFYDFMDSDANLVDASFIRMKSLSLNYILPNNIIQNLRMKQAQVYLNAQNLFTLTPYKGYDPQRPAGINLPTLTSVHLGIKLTI